MLHRTKSKAQSRWHQKVTGLYKNSMHISVGAVVLIFAPRSYKRASYLVLLEAENLLSIRPRNVRWPYWLDANLIHFCTGI